MQNQNTSDSFPQSHTGGAESKLTMEETEIDELLHKTVGAGLEGCRPQPQSNEDVDVEEAEITIENAEATEEIKNGKSVTMTCNDEQGDEDAAQPSDKDKGPERPRFVAFHYASEEEEEEEEEEEKKKDDTDTDRSKDAAQIQKSTRNLMFVLPRAASEEEKEQEQDCDADDLAGDLAMQERHSLISVQMPGKPTSTRRMSHLQKLPSQNFNAAADVFEDDKKVFRLRWYHAIFLISIASLVVCLLQLFTAPPFGVWMTTAEVEEIEIAPEGCEDGLEHCICPRETICATNTYSIVLLALARCSAFFDYPLYMMMFLSKCHNINNICRRTVLREYIDFADMHKVHKLFGVVVGIETMSHSFFHMLRWGLNGDISLLWETNSGITGLITMIITPLICWPMFVPVLKQNMKFELRKGLHYLAVVWAMALLWHAPSRIYYLIGIPALIYAVDYLFGFFIRNTLIENAHFERYGENGVAVSSILTPSQYSYVFILPLPRLAH